MLLLFDKTLCLLLSFTNQRMSCEADTLLVHVFCFMVAKIIQAWTVVAPRNSVDEYDADGREPSSGSREEQRYIINTCFA